MFLRGKGLPDRLAEVEVVQGTFCTRGKVDMIEIR